MPKYNYIARDETGKIVKGNLDALDEKEVIFYLQKQRLKPERIKASMSSLGSVNIGGGSGVKMREVMSFTRMMATFARASVPLNSALAAMEKQAESVAMKRVIKKLIIGVESGRSMSDACREQPKVFDTIYTNMLAAGEASGNLANLMERLADMMEKNDAIKSKVKGAMSYPIFVSCVAVGAVVILLAFVLPQFIKMFADSGVPLPLPTKVTVAASNGIRHHGFKIVGVIAVLIVAYKQMMKNPKAQFKKDGIMLKMPVFGALIMKSTVSRFSRTLGTLIMAGVTIVDAILLVEKTTPNRVIAKALENTRIAISSGKGLAETLDRTNLFPPMVVSMIDAGESTGGLDSMLGKIADYYEMDVNRAVDSAIKLIEPAMMVVFGAIVLVILLSIYMPMFSMLSVLKK